MTDKPTMTDKKAQVLDAATLASETAGGMAAGGDGGVAAGTGGGIAAGGAG